MKRGLVLGGGGIVGVAWETGVLKGLADEGIDLTGEQTATGMQPDAIVGTSAGSIVGALMTTNSPAELIAKSLDDSSTVVPMETVPLLDLEMMIECFGVWQNLPNIEPATLKAVGTFALRTNTVTEDRWVGSITQVLGTEWRSDRFRCTAVNAETGDFAVWSQDSGVPLDRAVASSCAVPCIFPTVTINGGRFTDGGLRSGTSMDLLAGFGRVLTLAPIGSWMADSLDASAALSIKQETAIIEATGGQTVTMLPDDETNQATLTTSLGRMDSTMRQAAIEHGVRQGRALAASLRNWW